MSLLKMFSDVTKDKKKTLSNTPTSRIFSPSSERFIVNRIHDSMSGSFDLPSNPANSFELEPGHVLESVAETEEEEEEGGGGAAAEGGRNCLLPTEDDIEKSFRVNQDGSMTVEMRVRLTIKEEETVHWTTTLSRSSVANQSDAASLLEAEDEAPSVKSLPLDLSNPATSVNTIKDRDKTEDDDDEEEDQPPPLGSGALTQNHDEEDVKGQRRVVSPRGAPAPGHKQIRQKQASVESIQSVSADGREEELLSSYSYREEAAHGAVTQQYCLIQQTKPVPKPRRFGSVDGNRSLTRIKSAGMAEILQIESSGEEVTETVLHIYEQQNCQDNFLANLFPVPAPDTPFSRPMTSGSGQLTDKFEPNLWRPSTASESISIWRAENMSPDRHIVQEKNVQLPPKTLQKGERKAQQNMRSRGSKKQARRLTTPGKLQKDASKKPTKVKGFSSAGFLRKIYGNRVKTGKSQVKVRPRPVQNGDEAPSQESTPQLEDSNMNFDPCQSVNGRGLLTRQTSLHQEKNNIEGSCSIRATVKTAHQYVESWLENIHRTSTDYRDLEDRGEESVSKEELSPTSQVGFGVEPLIRAASVKQRIQTFEHKSERQKANQSIVRRSQTNMDTDKCRSSAQTEMQESPSAIKDRSVPVKISLHNVTTCESFSADLPLPPPPAQFMELPGPEDDTAASSPLYKLSPESSHMSFGHPVSNSTAREETASARTPPVKRAPLLSNQSLDRTMSQRKEHANRFAMYTEAEPLLGERLLQENSSPDAQVGSSCCSSTCPSSSLSEGRTSTESVSSTEASSPRRRVTKPQSPKKLAKRAKLQSCASPKSPSAGKSPRHGAPETSPFAKRKQNKSLSPYSQSLDMMSPPVNRRSSGKTFKRNLSMDNADETQRKKEQCSTVHEAGDAELEIPEAEIQLQLQPRPQKDMVSPPNMKPVLEEICFSIKAIRRITRSKRQSCLEKSNSLPDFSSHVASTFGSSSKALLAFLSVMTLKDSGGSPGACQLDRDNAVSCAEALRMIDSLREIAAIEDSHELRASLSALRRSASEQLMRSWRGFQELSDRCKSSTSDVVAAEAKHQLVDHKMIIDELVKDLGLPVELKEELASLSPATTSDGGGKEEGGTTKEEMSHIDVSAIVKKFNYSHEPKDYSSVNMEKTTGAVTAAKEECGKKKDKHCPMAEITEEQMHKERETNNDDEEKILPSGEEEEKQLCQKEGSTDDKAREGDMFETCTRFSEVEDENVVISECEHSNDVQREQNIFTVDEDMARNFISEPEHMSSDEGNHISIDNESDREGQEENMTLSEVEHEAGRSCVELSTSQEGKDEEECDTQHLQEERQSEVDGSAHPREEVGFSAEESTCYSEMVESSSEEERAMVACSELKVTVQTEEDRLYWSEQQQREEQEKTKNQLADQMQIEHQDSHSEEDITVNCDALDKRHGFSTDDDSGNDHSGCEEQVDVAEPNVENEQVCSYIEEELSMLEKEMSAEEEPEEEKPCSNVDTYIERRCGSGFQEMAEVKTPRDKTLDRAEEIISQSIAERVVLLEKQVAEAQRKSSTKNVRSPLKRPPQRNTALPLQSDGEDSELPPSRSAPQSSLSFSYDSGSGIIAAEAEGSRVRSIREMFLAKSSAVPQHGQGRHLPSPSGSAVSEPRADTSVSGGYQSQTSSDLSSGEDGSPRKSIAKGFVRRTIERLYGRRDVHPPAGGQGQEEEEEDGRPPSAANQKKGRGFPSIFSPFRGTRAKAVSELSYFHSANGLDNLGEAARCLAFNAQVGPDEAMAALDGDNRWLFGDKAAVKKSVSDPVGINKALTEPPQEESTPYSLFSTTGPEEEKRPASGKCTYFSLPHASDSDLCQEEVKESVGGSVEVVADTIVDTQTGSEKNGRLPTVVDFKMKDNKVHPLVEMPPDGEVVVVVAQPQKGHGVMSRRVQDPDVLDLLYDFCGQNCPIL